MTILNRRDIPRVDNSIKALVNLLGILFCFVDVTLLIDKYNTINSILRAEESRELSRININN